MALDQSALLEVLDALRNADADAGDRIKAAAETIYQALIDAELTAVIGAGPHELIESRTNHRNGSRPRTLSTVAGDLELRIPKLRSGSFFPALLERRRRVDECLFAMVMEAYLQGTSTRKVDDLVKALGADSGSPRARSRGSALIWTPRSPRFVIVRCRSSGFRTCSSTPPTARPASIIRCVPSRGHRHRGGSRRTP